MNKEWIVKALKGEKHCGQCSKPLNSNEGIAVGIPGDFVCSDKCKQLWNDWYGMGIFRVTEV